MFQVAQFFRHISLGRPAEAIALKPQLGSLPSADVIKFLGTQRRKQRMGWVDVGCFFRWETYSKTAWWFGTCFIFTYIGNNHPNCFSYFQRG